MKILIPTLGRSHWPRQRTTLSHIPDGWRGETLLVVQSHEERSYRAVADREGVGLLVLPAEIRTLPPTRTWIRDWLVANGHPKSVQMDDDIQFYTRREDHEWKLRDSRHPDVANMLEWIKQTLDKYAHIGVAGREGHNRVLENSAECTRYMRLLAYRTDVYALTEPGRMVDDYEDMDTNLQLLRMGFPSLVTYQWAQGQAKTSSPGGCSAYRTNETHDAAARRLADLHPGFVKLRQKNNKTGGEFGNRTEVTIYWKKAFETASKTVV